MVRPNVVGKQCLPSVQYFLVTDKLNIDHIQSIDTGNPELPASIDPQCIEYGLSALSLRPVGFDLPLNP